MQLDKYDQLAAERQRVITLLDQGICSPKDASRALGISQRQTERLFKKLKASDGNALVFLPKRRKAWNRKSLKIRKEIVRIKKENPSYSNQHITEIIEEELKEKISPSTVRRLLIRARCYKKEKQERRTFKKFEAKKFGRLLQMDTTEGCWLEGYRQTKLILVLDDYSRAILGFRWTAHDTTWENMLVLRSVILKYGLPRMIYTDNDSKFRTIRHGSTYFEYHKEEYETEIHKAMKALGIVMFAHPPYHAFAKGKIERLFRFIQERFLPYHTARDFKELNSQFAKWVRWYNLKHVNRMTGCVPKERFKPLGFKPLSDQEDLDWVFSLKETRKIDKYNSFSLNGIRYFLKNQVCLVGERVELAINPTHKIRVYWGGKFIQEFRKKKKSERT